jgi:hypothetical protein
LTDQNIEKLARHNLASGHIEKYDETKSTVNFMIPENAGTTNALTAAAAHPQRNVAVAGLARVDVAPVKKLMSNTVQNFLNLKTLKARIGTRDLNQIEIYTTVTREELVKMQGYNTISHNQLMI